MKKSKFKVIFIDNTEIEISAFNCCEAMIIAQAKRIDLAMNFAVCAIVNTETKEFYTISQEAARNLINQK